MHKYSIIKDGPFFVLTSPKGILYHNLGDFKELDVTRFVLCLLMLNQIAFFTYRPLYYIDEQNIVERFNEDDFQTVKN